MSDSDFTIQSSSFYDRNRDKSAIEIDKNMSILNLWSEKEVLLPHWCVTFDQQLDDIIHLKMTIAEQR